MATVRTKRVSIKDIAERAGVSISLVSFVLNGKSREHRVGEEIAERITRIAEEMRYVPNMVAKGLRSGRTYTIGFIIPDLEAPYFAKLSGIIEREASVRGYSILMGSTGESDTRASGVIELLRSRGVDGIIAAPNQGSRDEIERVASEGMPVIMVDRHYSGSDIATVTLDNRKAAYDATCGLIERGYRNIKAVTYRSGLEHIGDRVEGYLAAIAENGLIPEVFNADYYNRREGIERWIASVMSGPDKPDALLFMADILCVDGIIELTKAGYAIPEDVAVISFDKNDAFDLCSVPISYIEQPHDRFAEAAVGMLLKAVTEGEELSADKSVTVTHRICWRGSTPVHRIEKQP